VLATVASFLTLSLALAAEVTFVKFDKEKKELTVKDDKDVETVWTITDDTKFKGVDKDGKDVDVKAEKAMERLEKAKDAKKAPKFDVEVDKEKKTIKELKFKAGKKQPE
jgi:hypothetical protein